MNFIIDIRSLVIIIGYIVIFVLSLIGNILVILVLSRRRSTYTITNIYLINLAVSDLILAIMCIPFTLIGHILKNFIFGRVLCKIIPFLQAFSVALSVWTLVTISLERYFAICKPFYSRRWQTIKHSLNTLIIIWINAFCITFPIILVSDLKQIGYGSNYTKPETKYQYIYNNNTNNLTTIHAKLQNSPKQLITNINDNGNSFLSTKSTLTYACRELWQKPRQELMYTWFLNFALLITPLVIMIFTYTKISIVLLRAIKREKQNQRDGPESATLFKSSPSTPTHYSYLSRRKKLTSSSNIPSSESFWYKLGHVSQCWLNYLNKPSNLITSSSPTITIINHKNSCNSSFRNSFLGSFVKQRFSLFSSFKTTTSTSIAKTDVSSIKTPQFKLKKRQNTSPNDKILVGHDLTCRKVKRSQSCTRPLVREERLKSNAPQINTTVKRRSTILLPSYVLSKPSISWNKDTHFSVVTKNVTMEESPNKHTFNYRGSITTTATNNNIPKNNINNAMIVTNLAGKEEASPVTVVRRYASESAALRSFQVKRRIIGMLCIVVLEFFICWTPLYIITTWYVHSPATLLDRLRGSTLISVIHLISYVSACCNPISYCFLNPKFRKQLKHYFSRNRRIHKHGRQYPYHYYVAKNIDKKYHQGDKEIMVKEIMIEQPLQNGNLKPYRYSHSKHHQHHLKNYRNLYPAASMRNVQH